MDVPGDQLMLCAHLENTAGQCNPTAHHFAGVLLYAGACTLWSHGNTSLLYTLNSELGLRLIPPTGSIQERLKVRGLRLPLAFTSLMMSKLTGYKPIG